MATRYKIRTEQDISDAKLIVIGNTSNTNTGDNSTNSSSATSAQGTTADNALPKSGGTMTGDILGAVSYGTTGTRVTKIWATDLEVTNNPTIGGVKVGYLEIPQNSKSAAYTTVLADSGKHIYHPGADTTARIWTIDSNANVAYPIGTALTFVNDTLGGVITIAITTDTMVLAGAGTTGSRTLAASGVATAIKITSTRWIISGNGLS